jgi:small subunit ribosomal protein S17
MENAKTETSPRRRATKTGTVTSDKMDKSVTVRVDRTVLHERYKRYIKRSNKFMAHDAKNECRIGDTVEIVESRPLASRKRWRVRRIVRHATGKARPDMAAAD